MKIYATSDRGLVREMNQDYYFISQPELNYKLYVLADGMGGYNGGEIASKLAVESVKDYISENINKIEINRESLLKLVEQSMNYANETVHNKAKTDESLKEMGTTLEVCLINGNKIYIGHIGDSRVYRIRKNIIRKLTTDHSYVEKLVRDGKITREEAYNHPKKNMLIKALGCEEKIEPDILVKGFLKEDIILICSDGLTNMIRDNEIFDIIEKNNEDADKELIKRAKENGGYDNITAIIIRND